MRWLIGDVQGCARELDRLLSRIRYDPHRDELWCLGDLINRGPDSLAAIRLWRDVDGRGILGNHDVYALLAHSGVKKRKSDTLQALFDAPDVDELLAHLRELPVLVHLPGEDEKVQDVWIVHAGVHPEWTDLAARARIFDAGTHDEKWLQSPEVRFAISVRCCSPEGETFKFAGWPPRVPEPFRPWDELYTGSTLVVHGHWAQRGYYRGKRTMGLDSGCVYGGALTAWCQEEDRVVQVPGTGA